MFGKKKKKIEITDPYTLVIDWNKVKTVEEIASILKLIQPFHNILITQETAEKNGIIHLTVPKKK